MIASSLLKENLLSKNETKETLMYGCINYICKIVHACMIYMALTKKIFDNDIIVIFIFCVKIKI